MKNTYSIYFNVLKYSLLFIAILYLAVYLTLACNRIFYPFELEWEEGALVDHVQRLLSGQQLYVEPSIEFVPFFYPPLYFYICCLISKLIGIGFIPLRLVSIISSIGCFFILFKLVRRETGSLFCGILAPCLYAATYRITGAWLDIGRVDSLFMLFLLWSIYILRFYIDTKYLVLAGILISLSFLTKQTALFVAIPLSIYCFIYLPKLSKIVFPATFLIIIGLSTVFFNWLNSGWYNYYIYNLPLGHQIIKITITTFWTKDIMNFMALPFAISLFYIQHLAFHRRFKDAVFFLLLFAGMLGTSWSSRMHSGGYDNVLLPAYAVISLGFGLGISILVPTSFSDSIGENENAMICGNGNQSCNKINKTSYQCLVLLLCIFFFFRLSYNPLYLLPKEADVRAGQKFVQKLKNIQGEVFVPSHGYLSSLAGKRTYAHSAAIIDILRNSNKNNRAIKEKLLHSLRGAFSEKRFQTIIVDGPGYFDSVFFENRRRVKRMFIEDYQKDFILKDKIFESDGNVFYPVTGARNRPELVYELKK